MNEQKRRRIQQADRDALARRQTAITSLGLCFSRSEVMRVHHNVLIQEALDSGGIAVVETSEVKKARFMAYLCYWFAGLAAVIERYQELVAKGTIPECPKLTELLTAEFIDLVKPFRNAVAHCSQHDDDRVLALLAKPDTVPDRAEQVAIAFREYIHTYQCPPDPDVGAPAV